MPFEEVDMMTGRSLRTSRITCAEVRRRLLELSNDLGNVVRYRDTNEEVSIDELSRLETIRRQIYLRIEELKECEH